MGYWICPHEDYCGEMLKIATNTAQEFRGTVTKIGVCTFSIQFGVNHGPTDVLMLEFDDVVDVEVAYALGDRYVNSIGKLDGNPEGKTIVAEFPRTIYISVLASLLRNGSFKFSYWTVDKDPK